MATWRVPEDLRAQLQPLVPSRYRTLSDAVVDLCRKGLLVSGEQTNFSYEHLLDEQFYIPMFRTAKDSMIWETDHVSRPLIPLEVLGLKYVIDPRDAQHELEYVAIKSLEIDSNLFLYGTNVAVAASNPRNSTDDLEVDKLDVLLPQKCVRLSLESKLTYISPPLRGTFHLRVRRKWRKHDPAV